MSAATQQRADGAATVAPAAVRGSGLTRALHAEWTKLRTVSGPAWLLLGVAVLTVAVGAAATGATHCPQTMTCPVDTPRLSLTGVQFGQAVVAILAVLTVSNEYNTGMIRTTLAAMPGRLSVFTAKALLTASLVLAAGSVAVFGSLLAAHFILPGNGFTAARGFHTGVLDYGPAVRAACGSVLYLVLIALLSVGIAAILRDSAVSIGAVLAVLYVFPIVLAFIGNEHWQRRLERWTPTNAGLNIQVTLGVRSLDITPWAGLGVLALWAAAALVAGGLSFRFRDA